MAIVAASKLMSRCLAALASALFLVGCTFPGTVEARVFTTGLKSGQTLRFEVHTVVSGTLTAGPTQLPVNSDQRVSETLRVDSLDRSGTASVTLTIDTITDSSGAALTSRPPPVTLKIASDGRILSGSGAQLGGRLPSLPGTDQLTPILAGHAVKPGDSWDRKYERPNPFGSGGFHLSTRNKYLRDEDVSGRSAAVIDSTLSGPVDFTIDFSKLPVAQPGLGQGPVHYVGTVSSKNRYWLQNGTSQVLKASATGDYSLAYAVVVPPNQAGGPQQVSFSGRIKTDLSRL